MGWKILMVSFGIIKSIQAINMTYDTSPIGPPLHVKIDQRKNSSKSNEKNKEKIQEAKGRGADPQKNDTRVIKMVKPFDLSYTGTNSTNGTYPPGQGPKIFKVEYPGVGTSGRTTHNHTLGPNLTLNWQLFNDRIRIGLKKTGPGLLIFGVGKSKVNGDMILVEKPSDRLMTIKDCTGSKNRNIPTCDETPDIALVSGRFSNSSLDVQLDKFYNCTDSRNRPIDPLLDTWIFWGDSQDGILTQDTMENMTFAFKKLQFYLKDGVNFSALIPLSWMALAILGLLYR